MNTSNTYFIYRKYLSALKDLIFTGNGILESKSWNNPNGHILPQNSLPLMILNNTNAVIIPIRANASFMPVPPEPFRWDY
jgi:hypothetical protein